MEIFHLIAGEGPLVAAAIHNGHDVRPQVAELLALDEAQRLAEEDPYTDELTRVVPTRLIGNRSRFEMDLNRPREQAIYLQPDQAWGLHVWKSPPSREMIAQSLANYDLFYATAEAVLRRLVAEHRRVVVLDIHTYNHRRDGPTAPAADPAGNPEVNVGTGTMDRVQWAPVVDRFVAELREYDYLGRRLDVRENVKFQGGHFARWIHATFPDSVCALAVEFKKFFMDECTGRADRHQLQEIRAALASTAPGLLEVLADLKNRPLEATSP